MAVAAWLTEELRGRPEANGLLTPAVVVANFGTAGAYPDNQPVGQTVLISRVRDGRGESHYPERLLRWPGEEGECRTVPSPQVEVLEDDRGQPLFDMEAFGVAEATSLFLSSSHLLVGKCVCDHVGADSLDWKTLAERCQQDYERGAALFLDHARAHLEALRVDPRRQKGLAIAGAVNACLEAAAELALTVSQRRELAQHLRAHLARGQDPQEEGRRLAEGLALCPARGKSESKAALAALLVQLAPGGGPGATGRA